jgi:hypothetical protein
MMQQRDFNKETLREVHVATKKQLAEGDKWICKQRQEGTKK